MFQNRVRSGVKNSWQEVEVRGKRMYKYCHYGSIPLSLTGISSSSNDLLKSEGQSHRRFHLISPIGEGVKLQEDE